MAREVSREEIKQLMNKFSGANVTDEMLDSIDKHVPNFSSDLASVIGNMHHFDHNMKNIEKLIENKGKESDESLLQKMENIKKRVDDRMYTMSSNKEKSKNNAPEMGSSFGVGFETQIIKPNDIEECLYIITNEKTKEKTVTHSRKELGDFLASTSDDIDNFTIKKAKVE